MNERKPKGFLKRIRLTGAAGVDHPAHEHEGWLVCKSVDANGTDDQWLASVADAWLAGNEVKLR